MRNVPAVLAPAILLLLSACGGNSAPTPTLESVQVPTKPPTPPATPTETAVLETSLDPSERAFRVVVIVDTSSEDVSLAQAEALIADASAIHQQLSGFGVEMIDFVKMAPEITAGTEGDYRNLESMIYAYEAENPNRLPDGFMIFSFGHSGEARLYGGYTYTIDAPEGYDYRFVATVSNVPSYHVGVVHVGHRYANCGYGPDPEQLTPLQDTSFGGECRNIDGVACVEHNGYQMCSNAVDDLYASTPTYFAAATIVHETMHNFGVEVATDHYGTEACTAAMAASGSTREYDPNDFDLGDQYVNICPFLYDNFVDAFVYGAGSASDAAGESGGAEIPYGSWSGSLVAMGGSSESATIYLDFFDIDAEIEFLGVAVIEWPDRTETLSFTGQWEAGRLYFEDEAGSYYNASLAGDELSGSISSECYECASEYIFTVRSE